MNRRDVLVLVGGACAATALQVAAIVERPDVIVHSMGSALGKSRWSIYPGANPEDLVRMVKGAIRSLESHGESIWRIELSERAFDDLWNVECDRRRFGDPDWSVTEKHAFTFRPGGKFYTVRYRGYPVKEMV